MGDQFYKTEIPRTAFLFDVLEIFGSNFKAIRQILVRINYFKESTLA